jgi:hypothetical protein
MQDILFLVLNRNENIYKSIQSKAKGDSYVEN